MTIHFILIRPAVFFFIINKRRYAVQHTTLISYHTVQHVSVRMIHHQALRFTTVKKIVSFEYAIMLLVRAH